MCIWIDELGIRKIHANTRAITFSFIFLIMSRNTTVSSAVFSNSFNYLTWTNIVKLLKLNRWHISFFLWKLEQYLSYSCGIVGVQLTTTTISAGASKTLFKIVKNYVCNDQLRISVSHALKENCTEMNLSFYLYRDAVIRYLKGRWILSIKKKFLN